MHFKVKNAVTELSLRTMIVPVFTKGITSNCFLFTSFLLHSAISLKHHIKYITLANKKLLNTLYWHIKLKIWTHNHIERFDENV